MKKHFQKTALALIGTMVISSPLALANETKSQQGVSVIQTLNTKENITEGKFTDFFPDENFAQVVAEHLGKNSSDTVTAEELLGIGSIYAMERNIVNLDGIEYLSNVINLDFEGNSITSIPESIESLTDLYMLYINQNNLKSVPDSISNLSNLKILSLSSNEIEELPESMEKMTGLEHLQLYNNPMDIPEFIGNLTNLQVLDIGDMRLTEIPQFIEKLKNLEVLWLDGNKLVEIPEFIKELSNLEDLDVSNNKLTTIPEELFDISYLVCHGQTATLPTKTFDIDNELTQGDIFPNLILKVKEVFPTETTGIIEITKNGITESVKLEDVLDNKVNLNSLFSEVGEYKVLLKTEPREHDYFSLDNFEGHVYDYTLEITY